MTTKRKPRRKSYRQIIKRAKEINARARKNAKQIQQGEIITYGGMPALLEVQRVQETKRGRLVQVVAMRYDSREEVIVGRKLKTIVRAKHYKTHAVWLRNWQAARAMHLKGKYAKGGPVDKALKCEHAFQYSRQNRYYKMKGGGYAEIDPSKTEELSHGARRYYGKINGIFNGVWNAHGWYQNNTPGQDCYDLVGKGFTNLGSEREDLIDDDKEDNYPLHKFFLCYYEDGEMTMLKCNPTEGFETREQARLALIKELENPSDMERDILEGMDEGEIEYFIAEIVAPLKTVRKVEKKLIVEVQE